MKKFTIIFIIFIAFTSFLYGKDKVYIGLTQPITPSAVIQENNKILMSLDILGKLGLLYKSRSVNTIDLIDSNKRLNTYNYFGMTMINVYELSDALGVDYEKRNNDIILYNKINSVFCDNGYVTFKFAFASAYEYSYWNNTLVLDLIGSKYSDNSTSFNKDFENVANIAFGQVTLDSARCAVYLNSTVPNQKAVRKHGITFTIKLPTSQKNQLKDIKDLFIDSVGKDNIITIKGGVDLDYSLNQNVDTGKIIINFKNGNFASNTLKIYKTSNMSFAVDSKSIVTNPDKIKDVTFSKSNSDLIIKVSPLKGSDKPFKNLIICLDPGHGAKDVGAKYGTVFEKNINYRAITLLKEELESRGVTNIYVTRDQEGFLSLGERGQLAIDKDCDVFISIHSNSCVGENKISGFETYYRGPMPTALYLGQNIHNEILKDLPIPNKGLKKDTSLHKTGLGVLRKCNSGNIPGILIELGFINHSTDRALLLNDDYLKNIAKHIADGLENYITAKPYNEIK